MEMWLGSYVFLQRFKDFHEIDCNFSFKNWSPVEKSGIIIWANIL
jgi:hypothetical protein